MYKSKLSKMKKILFNPIHLALPLIVLLASCGGRKDMGSVVEGNAAEQAYVAPGEYDEFYAFMSGGNKLTRKHRNKTKT